MPPIDPDAPWWINAILIVIVGGLTVGGSVWVAQINTRRRLSETQAAVSETQAVVGEVREQVANTHSTNLRADIDLLGEAVHRVERHVTDMAESQRAVEHSLDRRYRIQRKDLEAAVEDRERAIQALADEIPGQIRDALKLHVLDCPARQTANSKEDENGPGGAPTLIDQGVPTEDIPAFPARIPLPPSEES